MFCDMYVRSEWLVFWTVHCFLQCGLWLEETLYLWRLDEIYTDSAGTKVVVGVKDRLKSWYRSAMPHLGFYCFMFWRCNMLLASPLSEMRSRLYVKPDRLDPPADHVSTRRYFYYTGKWRLDWVALSPGSDRGKCCVSNVCFRRCDATYSTDWRFVMPCHASSSRLLPLLLVYHILIPPIPRMPASCVITGEERSSSRDKRGAWQNGRPPSH